MTRDLDTSNDGTGVSLAQTLDTLASQAQSKLISLKKHFHSLDIINEEVGESQPPRISGKMKSTKGSKSTKTIALESTKDFPDEGSRSNESEVNKSSKLMTNSRTESSKLVSGKESLFQTELSKFRSAEKELHKSGKAPALPGMPAVYISGGASTYTHVSRSRSRKTSTSSSQSRGDKTDKGSDVSISSSALVAEGSLDNLSSYSLQASSRDDVSLKLFDHEGGAAVEDVSDSMVTCASVSDKAVANDKGKDVHTSQSRSHSRSRSNDSTHLSGQQPNDFVVIVTAPSTARSTRSDEEDDGDSHSSRSYRSDKRISNKQKATKTTKSGRGRSAPSSANSAMDDEVPTHPHSPAVFETGVSSSQQDSNIYNDDDEEKDEYEEGDGDRIIRSSYNHCLRTTMMPSTSLNQLLSNTVTIADVSSSGVYQPADMDQDNVSVGSHSVAASIQTYASHNTMGSGSVLTNLGNISVSITSVASKSAGFGNGVGRQASSSPSVGSSVGAAVDGKSLLSTDQATIDAAEQELTKNLYYKHGVLTMATLEQLQPPVAKQFHDLPPDFHTQQQESLFAASPNRSFITNSTPFPALGVPASHASKQSLLLSPSMALSPHHHYSRHSLEQQQTQEAIQQRYYHHHSHQSIYRVGDTIVPTEVLSTRRPKPARQTTEVSFLRRMPLTQKSLTASPGGVDGQLVPPNGHVQIQVHTNTKSNYLASSEFNGNILGKHVYHNLEKPRNPHKNGDEEDEEIAVYSSRPLHALANHYLDHHHEHHGSIHSHAANQHAKHHFDDDVASYYDAPDLAVGLDDGRKHTVNKNAGKSSSAKRDIRGIGSLSVLKGARNKKLAAISIIS
jgi:hypothetical protein